MLLLNLHNYAIATAGGDDLHFNMLLLNQEDDDLFDDSYDEFTFQYASIKPPVEQYKYQKKLEDLHFNMLLLNLDS